jgi:hypothetical protein
MLFPRLSQNPPTHRLIERDNLEQEIVLFDRGKGLPNLWEKFWPTYELLLSQNADEQRYYGYRWLRSSLCLRGRNYVSAFLNKGGYVATIGDEPFIFGKQIPNESGGYKRLIFTPKNIFWIGQEEKQYRRLNDEEILRLATLATERNEEITSPEKIIDPYGRKTLWDVLGSSLWS